MDFSEITRSLEQLWETKPGSVVLLALGFVVFVLLVIDTWRHKHKHDRRRPH